MKFKDIQRKNANKFNYFELEDRCLKEFIDLAIREFKLSNLNSKWNFALNDKRFNSFPNFLFKHQTCISHDDFMGATFQFRICNEENIDSFGYRLFIDPKDENHFDFITQNIAHIDELAMILKTEFLSEFNCISKCGWWITDIWKNMYKISEDSETSTFFAEMFNQDFTKEMLEINKKLLSIQNDQKLKNILDRLKEISH